MPLSWQVMEGAGQEVYLQGKGRGKGGGVMGGGGVSACGGRWGREGGGWEGEGCRGKGQSCLQCECGGCEWVWMDGMPIAAKLQTVPARLER